MKTACGGRVAEAWGQGQQDTMVPRGLEPRTLRLLAVRSNQLSYETFWQADWRGSRSASSWPHPAPDRPSGKRNSGMLFCASFVSLACSYVPPAAYHEGGGVRGVGENAGLPLGGGGRGLFLCVSHCAPWMGRVAEQSPCKKEAKWAPDKPDNHWGAK